jgi:glutamyl-tRNA synthetase
MGQGSKKLSKRDPEAHALAYRDQGFLPEGLLNYLALLGWAIAEDRDIFSMDEMVAAFEIERVNPNPARFDLKKAEAINATHLRALPVEELTARLVPVLQAAGVLGEEVTDAHRALLAAATPLVHERMTTLTESVDMLGFLFVDEDRFARDPADVEKLLNEDGKGVVKAAHDALAALDTWDTAAIDEALRQALVEDLGLKPRNAFGPVRVAVTGRRVSPPLFESLELLGRERALARLSSAQEA